MVLFERSNAAMDRYGAANGLKILNAKSAVRSRVWITYGRSIDVDCLPCQGPKEYVPAQAPYIL